MFKINDYVVTRTNGICQVINIDSENRSYKLVPLPPPDQMGDPHNADSESEEITVSADNDEIVREIMSKSDAEEVVDRMPYIPTLKIPGKNVADDIYKSAIGQFDPIELVKVIKTVYIRKKEQRLYENEPDYSNQAKTLLHSELTLALGIPIDKIEDYIIQSVKNNF